MIKTIVIARLTLAAALGVAAACGGPANEGPDQSVGLYSHEATSSVDRIKRKMKVSEGPTTFEEAQEGLHRTSERQLYNPNAKIAVDVIADGEYGLSEMTERAVSALQAQRYDFCLVMGSVRDALMAADASQALQRFRDQYKLLLDQLGESEVPIVVCEILPIIEDYQKQSYQMPTAQINRLIMEMNQAIYELAIEQADGIVFTHKTLSPWIHTGPDSIMLNKENSGLPNGVQPHFSGMRLLCQLFAQGLHKAGYRTGRILVLGDTVVANAAMTRAIDKVQFLLPKYLEIELNKIE